MKLGGGMYLYDGHQTVIHSDSWSLDSHQAVIRRSSDSHQMVIIWSSGCLRNVLKMSSDNGKMLSMLRIKDNTTQYFW